MARHPRLHSWSGLRSRRVYGEGVGGGVRIMGVQRDVGFIASGFGGVGIGI